MPKLKNQTTNNLMMHLKFEETQDQAKSQSSRNNKEQAEIKRIVTKRIIKENK
jgi:hypothetical protein